MLMESNHQFQTYTKVVPHHQRTRSVAVSSFTQAGLIIRIWDVRMKTPTSQAAHILVQAQHQLIFAAIFHSHLTNIAATVLLQRVRAIMVWMNK